MARARKPEPAPANGKRLATRQSVDQAIWAVCDIMRRGGATSALQYVPELTWILFLRSLPGGAFTGAGAGVKTNLLFFTRGKPTERIWYYDLSDVKVGKKTPLTLQHFDDFLARLKDRSDSDRSWTVDFAARKAKAAAEAQPFKDAARARAQEAEPLKDRLSALKKAKPRDAAAIAETEARIAALLKESREASNKAEAIENAVYDLKAVNPHRKADQDRRTPAELLDLIEAKGREVAEAIARLREQVG